MITTAALHELIVKQVRRCYETIEAHPDFEVAAADQIVWNPEVRDLIAASEAVDRLRNLHKPKQWSETSDVTVCRACKTAYPCESAELLNLPAVTVNA